MAEPSLGDIFAKYGTDKGSAPAEPWMWPQSYERIYEPLFAPIRHEPITLLELGWGEYDPVRKDHSNPDNGGRSARAWSEYFDKGEIVVVDITAKNFPDQDLYPDVWLYDQVDQTDPVTLADIHDVHGDFDIVIDDASHVSSLTIQSFKILWPWVKPGGLYIVEDLHSSYHPWWFGDTEADENPDTTVPTAVQFFKRLADEAFYRGTRPHGPKIDGKKTTDWDCFPKKFWLGYEVDEIRFCHPQLIVIRKR